MKRCLLALLALVNIFTFAAAQAQYVTLTGQIQGSNGIVADDYTLSFTPNSWFIVAGTAVVVSTTTHCATSVDGSVVGLPNPLQPLVLTSGFSGTLPPANYYVEYTFYTASTETLPSPEGIVQLTSTGQITVNAPAGGVPAGTLGMRVYVGTSSGTETLQGQTTGNSSYVQNVPLVAGVGTPASNNTICQQIANDAGWPTGTGYNVALADSSGNVVPGYPMLWQLLGPNSTINLSTGIPYYHGVVTFPSPILATPYNHNLQSISGPLSMSGYPILNVGGISFSACPPVTSGLMASSVNTVVNALCFAGADIGAQINAAFVSPACASQCTVYVPAGSYSFSTTIILPLLIQSNYLLLADQGAVLTYTGSGDMIQAPVSNSPNVSNWRIHGGHWVGTSAAASGLHILPTNSASVTGMMINGFTNGPGLWIDGANGVTVFDNTIQGNQDAIKISPTYCSGAVCGTGVTGSPFSPNQIAILSNRLTNNSQWGFISTDPVTSQLEGAQSVTVAFNDLEINGVGALEFGRSHGAVILGNYFEGSPQQIVLGIPGGADGNQFRFFASQGTLIQGNFFTDTTATPYDINLLDTADAVIQGNTSNQVSQNSSNCSVNTLANNSTNIGETGTVFGKNHFEHYSGMGNLLCIAGAPVVAFVGSGSYSQLNQNYFPLLVNSNFAIGSGSSETVTVSGNVTAASQCFVTPFNSTAGGVGLGAVYYIPSGANTGTFYHPSGQAGTRWNIWCSGVPN